MTDLTQRITDVRRHHILPQEADALLAECVSRITELEAEVGARTEDCALLSDHVGELVKGQEIQAYRDRVVAELKKVSAGEPNTWGFVSMFIDILDGAL